jgi:hypothetical protein
MIPCPRAVTCGAMLLACLAAPAAPQGQSAAAGASFERYSFGNADATTVRSIALLAFPLGVDASLIGPLALQLRGAFAHGTLTRSDATQATLAGLTDTDVRLVARFAQGRLSLIGLASLPTGAATQSASEAEVASIVAADLLPFRIAYWGAGGGAGVGTAWRADYGGLRMHAGASYLFAREFEPLATDRFGYRPGNQASANLGVEQEVGESGRIGLQLSMQRYQDDALDGERLYRPGDRVQAIGSFALVLGDAGSAIIYAGGMHRGEGSALHALSQDAPAQTLMLAGGGMRLALGGVTLLPSMDTRIFRSEDGVGQGWLAGAGLAVELPAGPLTLAPSARGRFGNIVVRQGRESGISGVDVALTARLQAGRR